VSRNAFVYSFFLIPFYCITGVEKVPRKRGRPFKPIATYPAGYGSTQRERNNISARKCRVKKAIATERQRLENLALRAENLKLRAKDVN
jgi:hypothetical protein